MYGFNVLGINSHSHNHNSNDIDGILLGASKDLDSFKEVEEALKKVYTKEEVDLLLAGYNPEEGISLKDYLKKADADAIYLPKGNYLTEHQSLDGYAKKTDIPDTSNFLTEHQSLAGYAKTSDIPDVSSFITESDLPDYSNVYQPKGNYLTQSDLEGYAKTSDIVGDTPEAFDTLKEISDWLKNDDNKTASDIISVINSNAEELNAVSEKVNNIPETVLNITENDINNWNNGNVSLEAIPEADSTAFSSLTTSASYNDVIQALIAKIKALDEIIKNLSPSTVDNESIYYGQTASGFEATNINISIPGTARVTKESTITIQGVTGVANKGWFILLPKEKNITGIIDLDAIIDNVQAYLNTCNPSEININGVNYKYYSKSASTSLASLKLIFTIN